ncbi:biotin/lipoyl-containing protein, partial [Streptomyces sp. NPDC003006]
MPDEVITLPALGESVTEGTVTRWLKEVGEEVAADEPLLEVSTDKVDTEIPSPVAGVLLEIVVGEDETAAVGAKLAVVGAAAASVTAPPVTSTAGTSAPAAHAEQEAPAQAGALTASATPAAAPAPAKDEAPARPAAPATPAAPAAPASGLAKQEPPAQTGAPAASTTPAAAVASASASASAKQEPPAQAAAPAGPTAPAQPAAPAQAAAAAPVDNGTYVTPLVRKLASENGVSLSEVKGTGVGGRIRKQDVVAAAQVKRETAPARDSGSSTVSPLRGQTVKMTRMRKVIGDNMMKALHSQAQ